jgi:hypothetical protein
VRAGQEHHAAGSHLCGASNGGSEHAGSNNSEPARSG